MGYIEEGKFQDKPKGSLTITSPRFRCDVNGIYFLRGGTFQTWQDFFSPSIVEQKAQEVLTRKDFEKICLFYSQYVSNEIFFLYVDSIQNKGRAHLVKGNLATALVKNLTLYVDKTNRTYQKTLNITWGLSVNPSNKMFRVWLKLLTSPLLTYAFLSWLYEIYTCRISWFKYISICPPQRGTCFDTEIHKHFSERGQQLFAYNVGLTSVRGKRNPQNRKEKRAKKKANRVK